ncbi:MAG: hypothetical protein OIF34_12145, partial [Porticoccaceae bacterium]|nr:hypothetical protein [Porticoccaceae bacterium]
MNKLLIGSSMSGMLVGFSLSVALSLSASVAADALVDHKTAEMQRLKAEAQQTLAQDVVEFNGYDGRPISDGPFN